MRISDQDVEIVQVEHGTTGEIESRRCEVRIDGLPVYRGSCAECRREVMSRFPGIKALPSMQIPDRYR